MSLTPRANSPFLAGRSSQPELFGGRQIRRRINRWMQGPIWTGAKKEADEKN
jgi:hypothetical protein